MLAFLQYLFALLILDHADSGGDAAARPDVVGILLAVAGFALAARVVGIVLGRLSVPGDRRAVARILLVSAAGRIAALAVLHLIAGPLGAVRIPAALGVESWVLVPHLVRFVPYFALVAGAAWGLHPASSALHVGARTGARAVADEFRNALLPLSPVFVFVTLGDLPRLLPAESAAGRAYSILQQLPAVQAFAGLATVFAVLLAMPFAMRLALRAKPLPDGPLRGRLEAYSRRIGLRYRDILVWPTDGDVLNAAVIGTLPRLRYVLVTDALLATLSEDEIEAVFAHEAGHARRGHVLLFFGFTSVLGLIGFVPAVARAAGVVLSPLPPFARVVVLLLVWLGVVFGWVSRRFEQEADVFGIDTLPMPDAGADPATHPFARAMERIGAEVGAISEVTGWRHFSIADRVAFVHRYLTDEAVRRSYRRSILVLRGTLLLVIGGFALGAAVQVPGEIAWASQAWTARSAPEGILLDALRGALEQRKPATRSGGFAVAAAAAHRAGRDADAARWLRESVALGQRDAGALAAYAEMLEKSARPLGALSVWSDLAARDDAPPQIRETARRRAAAAGSR